MSPHALPFTLRHDLPRARQLVPAGWLARLMRGQAVPEPPRGDWLLFEVGFDNRALYDAGHIPDAHHLDTSLLEQAPDWTALPPARLLAALATLGIDRHSSVVLYGRPDTAAARVAQLMIVAGVADVRLLDGGLTAWERAGLPLTTSRTPAPMPRNSFGRTGLLHAHCLVGTTAVRALLEDPACGVLASVRTREEFDGLTSGYDYIEAAGEIPGAVWAHAGVTGDVNGMQHYQHADGTMLPAATIAGFWREAGIVAGQLVCFYCGTGWRASQAFVYAWLMGWERISVYDGGWLVWSADAANPRREGPLRTVTPA